MGIHETRRANLRWLLQSRYGGVAAQLARELGIQSSQLSRLFSENPRNHRNIGTKLARAIERVANQPIGWMDEPHRFDTNASPGAETVGTYPGVLLRLPGHRMVPILDSRQAGEWTASTAPYAITERTEVLWTSLTPLSDYTFALVIEGESMAEEFYPGDIVLIDPQIAPKPGDHVVAKLGKEESVLFRKYRLRGTDEAGSPVIELVPLNEDYPTTVIDSRNPGHLVGTMVEHRKYRRTDRLSPPQPYVVRRPKM